MKRILCVVGIVMLFASMVFAAGITKKDLAALKGTWEGTATGGGGTLNAKLEVMNDTEPLQGKITFTGLPGNAKSEYKLNDPLIGESNDGKITSAGTIMFTGSNGFFEIQSIKDKTLKGWGYFAGFKANITAKKK
jgi:opacity protein-like surface antigen